YFAAMRRLVIAAWGGRIEIDDTGLMNPSVHASVEQMAKKHALDYQTHSSQLLFFAVDTLLSVRTRLRC
ncbi:MAG TPA: hypothetical protein VL197_07410, partial [Nitrospirota bacterium]|nr:hypothetical protein [Nitrospirota bacterium]